VPIAPSLDEIQEHIAALCHRICRLLDGSSAQCLSESFVGSDELFVRTPEPIELTPAIYFTRPLASLHGLTNVFANVSLKVSHALRIEFVRLSFLFGCGTTLLFADRLFLGRLPLCLNIIGCLGEHRDSGQTDPYENEASVHHDEHRRKSLFNVRLRRNFFLEV
jgi:hypothetical protein